jgi:signal transduction histidine kinase
VAIEDRAFAIIMNNLLVNACKHSGGRQVTINAGADDLVARVTLTDDGRGVPAHLRANVFELGKRGQGTSGSGLGLYVTRELARAFGGDIELADARRGASFVLTLPLAAAEAS